MPNVIVKWLPKQLGGRQSPPPIGHYYPTAKFSGKHTLTWSVVFDFKFVLKNSDGSHISTGFVYFLTNEAPISYFNDFHSFDVYEGPHRVAQAYLYDQ